MGIFASSWVNPDIYRPRSRCERDIDLVMVANFGRYKRHHVLFSALARIPREKRPKVTLVGQPQGGRTAGILLREMDDHGVRDCITLRSRISDAEVVDILCRSKAALISSLREGYCVAAVEAMILNPAMRGADVAQRRRDAKRCALVHTHPVGECLLVGICFFFAPLRLCATSHRRI
jgi:glycosyltransferase involved in cell wall biosynthesis